MTPKSLFNIILKVIGLFFFKEAVMTILHLFTSFYYLHDAENLGTGIWVVLSLLVNLVVFWFIGYFLVFKTERIIHEFKLDQGFDQNIIPLNMHRSTILSISIFVIGGLTILQEIPDFMGLVYDYLIRNKFDQPTHDSSKAIVISLIKIGLGIALILAQRPIVNAIELNRVKANQKMDDTSGAGSIKDNEAV